MSRLQSHINTASSIISSYKGEIPLAIFLKQFFAKEKKYGSKDRRSISSLCYNYYRINNALKEDKVEDKLLVSLSFFSTEKNEVIEKERPHWIENIDLSMKDKFSFLKLELKELFRLNNSLSTGIDIESFNFSFLQQPDVFLRLRPGKEKVVAGKLMTENVEYRQINDTCIAVANGTKLEELIDINREAVIQDFNSQRVGELLTLIDKGSEPTVWDCCAASGGKAIMAFDLLPKIQLTVSDIRQSIIHNLKSRFTEAGIRKYESFVADVTNAAKLKNTIGNRKFDIIICDAPCSGSGTWSRTPEQLTFFKEAEIIRYSNLQKSIAINTSSYLKNNGYLLYITCSVFKQENEEVANYIVANTNLQLVKQQLFLGYNDKADSMFAALFKMED